MEDANSQYASRRASPPTASRHAQARATTPPISERAVPSRWERERHLRLRRGAGAGSVGVVPKWRSAATASLSPPSGAGAVVAVGSGAEATGLSGQREKGAQPERAACRRRRGRTEGRFAESSGLRALGGSGGWTWIGVTGVGRAAGIRRPRGTCSCPEASWRAAGRVLGPTWCLSLTSGPSTGAPCVSSLLRDRAAIGPR